MILFRQPTSDKQYNTFIFLLFFIFLQPFQAIAFNDWTPVNINDLNTEAERLQASKPDSTIFLAQKALSLMNSNEKQQAKAFAFWNLSQAYLYKHEYYSALIYGQKGIGLLNEEDTSKLHLDMLGTLGWVYYDMGNTSQAIPYHEKALNLAVKKQDLREEITYLNALGLDAMDEADYMMALNYFQKAEKKLSSESTSFSYLLSAIYNNQGIIYSTLEDWTQAKIYLLKSLELNTGGASSLVETYTYLAKVERGRKDFKQAKVYLQKAAQYVKQTNYSFALREFYEEKMSFEEIQENFKEAFLAQKEFIALDQKIKNGNIHTVTNHLLKFQQNKIEQDEKLLTQEKEIKQMYILFSIAIVSAIILLATSITLRLRHRMKQKALEQQLLKESLNSANIKNTELSDELVHKSKLLEDLALTISQRNEILQTLRENISNSRSEEMRKVWFTLTQMVEQVEKIPQAKVSAEVSQDFLYRIHEQFPDLTDKEIQLILQIRSHLSSKEIAELNNVEVRSVEMGRYRLRKKLGLAKGESLKDFIFNI
ncbi:tetratricopeptide repeat protein [Sediminitomix flava]|uniref:Tetratricopeptide repeat protein n=1 Tax=Sediminitomix flava TaxID=379075 RepID=A0A315ZDD1_SEDFL|nr:tetratricopeptide repeat protein [Sediminitomix flava]PWJ43129.1 tetratricopeptide repeat protein [Sediminitomix flava]